MAAAARHAAEPVAAMQEAALRVFRAHAAGDGDLHLRDPAPAAAVGRGPEDPVRPPAPEARLVARIAGEGCSGVRAGWAAERHDAAVLLTEHGPAIARAVARAGPR